MVLRYNFLMKKTGTPKPAIHWVVERMNRGERPLFLKLPPSITSLWRGRFPAGVHNGSYLHIIPSAKQDIFELRFLIDPIMRPEITDPIEISRDYVDEIIKAFDKAKDEIAPEERMSYYGR